MIINLLSIHLRADLYMVCRYREGTLLKKMEGGYFYQSKCLHDYMDSNCLSTWGPKVPIIRLFLFSHQGTDFAILMDKY